MKEQKQGMKEEVIAVEYEGPKFEVMDLKDGIGNITYGSNVKTT